MSNKPCHIYLIPGFFGFTDLGGITYFHHVNKLIENQLKQHGLSPTVHEVDTLPTSSIRKRAARLFETIQNTADNDSPIYLIGHSTGGLDARLMVTPNAALGVDEKELEGYAKRVKAVVSVATPHHGTPIASFFSSVLGSQLLYLISIATVYTMGGGRLPLKMMLLLGKVLTRADDFLGFDNSILDQFYSGLFSNFDEKRQDRIRQFLSEVKEDRSLLGQLTPGGLDLLNAATEDRESVRYGSVVMKARKPGWKAMKKIGLDPYRQASHSIYKILHYLVGDRDAKYPSPTQNQIVFLAEAFEEMPDARDSDGVVPTLSQIWGEIFYAGFGDHLDVCGHFNDFKRKPPHYDWIATGSNFDFKDFQKLWTSVCDFLLKEN